MTPSGRDLSTCPECQGPIYFDHYTNTWLHADDNQPLSTCNGFPRSGMTLQSDLDSTD